MPATAQPGRPRIQKTSQEPQKNTTNNGDPQKNTIGCAPQLEYSAGNIQGKPTWQRTKTSESA
jgi:hypothetical protein